eukprot:6946102-Alexandrium_andersonii.AAC.1
MPRPAISHPAHAGLLQAPPVKMRRAPSPSRLSGPPPSSGASSRQGGWAAITPHLARASPCLRGSEPQCLQQ